VGIAVTTSELLQKTWEWHTSVVAGCALLGAAYIVFVRPLQRWRVLSFLAGVLLLLFTLVGPLDGLGDDYLFSAHMLEHIVFLVAVPPLVIMGLPREAVTAMLRWRPASVVERALRRPWVAWLVAVGTLYLWHLPALYNEALADERVHITQHLSFLVTATVFWWPVLAPLPDHRLRGHTAILYLFLAAVANSVLGAVLTFSAPGLYPLYTRPTDGSAALALIRQRWGLDPAADQQLGGLFMWVVGGLFFLIAVLGMYTRWYRESGYQGTP
jgi:cytochrome c oxidase assembly factor CtaG